MAPVVNVSIPGLEKQLPNRFQLSSQLVTIQEKVDANRHNEQGAYAECRERWGSNDAIVVSGWQTSTGYQLDIKFDGHTGIQLFRTGRIVFDYNASTQKWSFKGYVPGERARREWAFCEPGATVDVVVAALGCFDSKTLSTLTKSILQQRRNLAQGSIPYQNSSDCLAEADPCEGVPDCPPAPGGL